MGRSRRVDVGGYVYHVLNRGNGRMTIFEGERDFEAFERVLAEAVERFPNVGLVSYCLMPNHWHLVLYPRVDGELSRFVGWLTLTHTQRWHAHRHTTGGGHVYQGRFKSFLVQTDRHLATVCRYVERNALRAGLVKRAEDWAWSSLWRWQRGLADDHRLLCPWPGASGRRPPRWVELVNRSLTAEELEALREAGRRGGPYGDDAWRDRQIAQFGLEATVRPRGRPRKGPTKGV